MTKLVFSPPGPDAPGYLKRVRQSLVFATNLQAEKPSPEMVDRMVDFLAQYVTEPSDQEAKIDALWMASEAEFTALLRAVTGEVAEDETNPTSAARLNDAK